MIKSIGLRTGLGIGWLIALALIANPSISFAADPTPTDILHEIPAGVIVHLGTTDGALEASLAHDGNVLVHGLAMNDDATDKARRAIQSQGEYGLATIDTLANFQALPYSDNLVNGLIADVDALGADAPAPAEIQRILTPGTGIAWIKSGGTWSKTTKPRPATMDDWSHFDHGPDGNGVSHDSLVAVPDALQWISGIQGVKTGDNPAKYHVVTGMRVVGGKVYYEWFTGESKTPTIRFFYSAHDAFNGVPLWNVPTKLSGKYDWAFVADNKAVYTFLEKAQPAVALDAQTGKVLVTFDKGPKLSGDPARTCLRITPNALIVTSGATMAALDPGTGDLKWSHTEKEGDLLFTTVSTESKKVFAIVDVAPAIVSRMRWPGTEVASTVCIDLETGREIWRNVDVAKQVIGQAIPSGNNLVLFGSVGIGGAGTGTGYTGCIDIPSGKLLWQKTFTGGGQYKQTWGLNMLVRDGAMFYATPWNLFKVDLSSGDKTLFWGNGYNQRCNRFSATDSLFILGLGTMVDSKGNAEIHSITRSGCAQGATLANGMDYYTPNVCGCITQIRGHLALSAEPMRKPAAQPLDAPSVSATPNADLKPTVLDTALTHEWEYYGLQGIKETAPLKAGENTLVACVQEHRLECRDAAGKVLWAIVAGGRITSPPIVVDRLAYFGAHDGCVYAVDIATGKLAWRFRAAPYQRLIVAYGQLESAWPVFGVCVHDGKIVATAGLHPETGGGIYAYGLDPQTGRQMWTSTLARTPIAIGPAAGKRMTPNRVLNDVPTSDGTLIHLPGIDFSPSDDAAALQLKLIPPPAPKKH